MKHNKYELTHKKFIKAKKRLEFIRKEMRDIPYRELKEPYQEGWILSLVLRDDLLKSDKGSIINSLLEKYEVKTKIKSSKIISKIRKNPDFYHNNNRSSKKDWFWASMPYIKNITEKEYKILSEQHKKYFDPISPFMKRYVSGDYEFNIPSYYLMIKVKKRIITHVQDINPILLKEEAELKRILEPYWRQCSYGQGYYYYYENRKERRKSKVELTKIELEQE